MESLRYRLGLDLGARSLGWQVLELNSATPVRIAACGVHTFDAGVEGDIEGGRDESRAAARRQARQIRRQFWRRQRRRLKILRLLQSSGLLPHGDISTPDAIHQYFLRLDADLMATSCNPESTDTDRVMLPYRLRAAALDRPLSPHELGRAIYHLGQRRGFKSNRKERTADEDASAKAKEKELGDIKSSIKSLAEEIEASGARTLGEHFARLNPRAQRVRRRHTHRDMFVREFELIWTAQAGSNPRLTPELRMALSRALFDQRPLKNQGHLIGECELLPGKRRAPLGLRIAQEFRLLQKLNDLRVERFREPSRPLTDEQRRIATQALSKCASMTFHQLKTKLKLPKDANLNLEAGGEEKLPGNRTDAKLRAVFGARWDAMTDEERDAVVDDLLTFEKEDALKKRGIRRWNLDEDAATKFAGLPLESKYLSHSPAALRRLVELMREGVPYASAKLKLYGNKPDLPLPDRLPPVRLIHRLCDPNVLISLETGDRNAKIVRALKSGLGNPAVERALTEMRKVVNAIIGRYGKPDTIHLELARDLRNPRKARERLAKQMRSRQQEREKIIGRIQKVLRGREPSRADVEKGLLWEECRGQCPYTGRSIDFDSLFGGNPEFDIEHIIPLSRSLDDSFANKTLCYHEENRSRKRNRTPYEAYAGDDARWQEILGRVKRFSGPNAEGKLRKFLTDESRFEELYADFTARQLNDTRYASKLAAEYLGCLFGGQIDADGRRRVQVSAGGVTAFLRGEWGLNGILGLHGEKNRQDHRHHAVDALAIALADPKTVKMLSDAAEHAEAAGRRRFAKIPPPWDGFLDEARQKINQIVVSRRINRRVRGPLHLETIYGHPRGNAAALGAQPTVHHVRKPVTEMTTEQRIEAIVDNAVRRAVEAKLREVGGDAKRFEDDPPTLLARDGRQIPIRRVRVRETVTVAAVGDSAGRRYVKPGTNHHVAIVAVRDRRGREKWEARPVSLLEAHRRRDGMGRPPIVQRNYGPDTVFIMAIVPGDSVIIAGPEGGESICYVTSVSEKHIELRRHTDARKTMDVRKAGKAGGRLSLTLGQMQEMRARKVRVTHLGDVVPAND